MYNSITFKPIGDIDPNWKEKCIMIPVPGTIKIPIKGPSIPVKVIPNLPKVTPKFIPKIIPKVTPYLPNSHIKIIPKVTPYVSNTNIKVIPNLSNTHIEFINDKSISLENEYARYSNNMKLPSLFYNLNKKFSVKPFLERWFIVKEENQKLADDAFISELIEKTYITKEKALFYLNSCKNVINSKFVKLNVINTLNIKVIGNITKYSYGSFKSDLETVRVDVLKAASLENGYSNGDELIAIMLMRYSGSFSYHRQFSINLNKYKEFVKEGVTIEGFSSPFNSQLLLINHQSTDKKFKAQFCSLYFDTDSPFGSIGSFFNQNFENKKVMVFPPMIEPVIDNMIKFILSQIEQHPCIFYIGLPDWTDMVSINSLLSSKWLIKYETNSFNTTNPHNGQEYDSKIFNLAVVGRE